MARSLSSRRPFGTDQHLAKRDLIISAPEATLSFEEVSVTVSTKLDIPVYSEFEHALEYVAQSDGKVVYAYTFQLRDNPVTRWAQVIVIPRRNPTEGFLALSRRSSTKQLRRKWSDGRATEGNNAIALSPSGKTTRAIRKSVFKTKFNDKEDPGSVANIAAAAVNLFYLANVMHDITYRYGFTEKAGNFQKNNFGLGGKDNDAVTINVLDPSKTNGAKFLTPR
ncbi:hypothetical protein BASA60_003847 [Batrachochytrium salamandrivorans]|nr:hypothetical protein BASA60_003847 [Batrachochytrium salamandrivorans]